MQDANYGLTLAMIKNIKATLFLFIGFLAMAISCNTGADEMKADNALDGGRYFIENYMKGDFSKAKLYLLGTGVANQATVAGNKVIVSLSGKAAGSTTGQSKINDNLIVIDQEGTSQSQEPLIEAWREN